MALFEKIVNRLKIPKEFLARYSPALREKFREAALKFGTGAPADEGLDQCLHLASSVVLRQEPADLDETLAAIQNERGLEGTDAETVLTVATAYYLLQTELHRLGKDDAADREDFRRVQLQFDAKEWLVGKEAMRTLGIEAV